MLLQWVRNNIYCGKQRKIVILKPKKKKMLIKTNAINR